MVFAQSLSNTLFLVTIIVIIYSFIGYCAVKLSDKPITSPKNLAAILFFGLLIFLGYTSVVITVIEIVKGEDIIGNR